MEIVVDRSRCAGLGVCEALAPKYFDVNDDGVLGVKSAAVSDDDSAAVHDAVDGCPTQALQLVD